MKFVVKYRKDKISQWKEKSGRRRGERTRGRAHASVWRGECAHPPWPMLGGSSERTEWRWWWWGESGRVKRRRPETRVLGENSPTGTVGYVGHQARDGPRRRGCTWASRAERERAKAPALAIPGVTPIAWASRKVRDGDASVRWPQ